MPITADLGGKNYTLGRGRVFFDRYPTGVTITATTAGEGERYFGNTPEFSTSAESEDLEHFDSDQGVKVKDDSVQLSFSRNGSFNCDNVSTENLALYFLGEKATLTQASATGAITQATVKLDRFYQLGASPSNPSGVRKVSNVVCGKGAGFATPVVAAGNFEVDEDLGRIYVLANATDILDDDLLQFTFDVAAASREQVVSSSNSVYGSVRFVSDNPKGANRDFFFPYVKLSPDGDYALKGDDWQSMGFTMEILKKGSLESAYIDGRAA